MKLPKFRRVDIFLLALAVGYVAFALHRLDWNNVSPDATWVYLVITGKTAPTWLSLPANPLVLLTELTPQALAFVPAWLLGTPGIIGAYAMMVAAAAFPLQRITARALSSEAAGLLAALLFLLWVPAWGSGTGAVTFGTELAFPVFFFASYWTMTKGELRKSAVLFFLTAFTHYGFNWTVTLFGALVLLGAEKLVLGPARKEFGLLLAVAGVLPFLWTYLLVGHEAKGLTALGTASTDLQWTAPGQMFAVFLALMVPFFFLPLLSKWSVMTLPTFILLWLYPAYIQTLFVSVHLMLPLTFLLLGTVEGLKRVPIPARMPMLCMMVGMVLALTLISQLAPYLEGVAPL